MAWIDGDQLIKKKENPEEDLERQLALIGDLDENVAKLELFKFLKNNLTFATQLLLGVNLFEYQSIILKTNMSRDYVLNILARGSAKTIVPNRQHKLLDKNKGVISTLDIAKGFDFSKEDHEKEIEELELWNGNSFQKTSKVLIQPKKECFKVTTNSGYFVEGSINHKIKVLDRKNLKIIWKRYHELDEENDYICISRNDKCFWGGEKTTKEEDEAYLIGVLLGDGSMSEKAWTITTADQEIIDFCLPFTNGNIGSKKGSIAKTLRLRNEYRDYLKNKYNLENGLSYTKKIPEKIFESKKLLKQTLKGLYDTDGCSEKLKGAISFSSVSEELINDVQNSLLFFGIISRRSKSKTKSPFGISHKITIYGENSLKYFKEVGFKIKRKESGVSFFKDKRLNPNLDVVYGAKELVNKIYEKNKKRLFGYGKGNFRQDSKEISYKKFKNVIEILKKENIDICSNFTDILDENFFFDKIKSKEKSLKDCFDFCDIPDGASYWCNGFINHNSFLAGIFALEYAYFNQGVKIGILAASFRQAKAVFKYAEDILSKPEAALFAQAVSKIDHKNDEWTMHIGNSTITSLPLGTGEKLRGFRFNCIIIDEMLLMPERIVNEVIIPFLGVVRNPTERRDMREAEDYLVEAGKMSNKDRYVWPNNKLISLSSASFEFEYLYQLYQAYEALIMGETNERNELIKNLVKTDATRAILHMSYEAIPEDIYDQNLIHQALSQMSDSQFDREFRSLFTSDSSGYFRMSKMLACTLSEESETNIELKGDPKAEYILAMDPSWAENETADHFAIQILKLNPKDESATLVHSFAVAGLNVKEYINYFLYLLDHFNIVAIFADYAVGFTFINTCNESQQFKERKLNLKSIDHELDVDYQTNLDAIKQQYNKKDSRIVFFVKFSTTWIRSANESLQAAFDRKKIFFTSRNLEENFYKDMSKQIPINDLVFENPDNKEKDEGRLIEFLDYQYGMMNLTKAECALIQVKSNASGGQTFEFPENLKRQKGPNRTRKDSYTALLIGNWGCNFWFDIQKAKVYTSTFEPFFV
jgi:hypothetical protein